MSLLIASEKRRNTIHNSNENHLKQKKDAIVYKIMLNNLILIILLVYKILYTLIHSSLLLLRARSVIAVVEPVL